MATPVLDAKNARMAASSHAAIASSIANQTMAISDPTRGIVTPTSFTLGIPNSGNAPINTGIKQKSYKNGIMNWLKTPTGLFLIGAIALTVAYKYGGFKFVIYTIIGGALAFVLILKRAIDGPKK